MAVDARPLGSSSGKRADARRNEQTLLERRTPTSS